MQQKERNIKKETKNKEQKSFPYIFIFQITEHTQKVCFLMAKGNLKQKIRSPRDGKHSQLHYNSISQ